MFDVSVIMPCFNCATTVGRAISSVLAQDAAVELILVDDCSSDHTVEVIQDFADRHDRVRLIRNSDNRGPGYSRNRGIDAATGRYVAFLDSDDVWLPGKLAAQVGFMDSHGLEFSYHDYYEVLVSGAEIIAARLSVAPDVADLPTYYYKRGYGMCLTSMISYGAISATRFPEDRTIFTEDYLFFLLLLSKGVRGQRLAQPLGIYTLAATSRSSNKLRQAASVLRSNFQASPGAFALPLFYFMKYAIAQVFALHRSKTREISRRQLEVLQTVLITEGATA